MSYSHRIADLQLAERLEAFGAVLIEGPKWCGKTTTAEQMSKSVIKMQDTEMQEEYAATAASKPSLLLMGETPLFYSDKNAWYNDQEYSGQPYKALQFCASKHSL